MGAAKVDAMADDHDLVVRLRAFQHLDRLRDRDGEELRRADLEAGFEFEGRRVPLLGPQGIFKPAVLVDAPLSITTVPVVEGKPRPYEDSDGPNGYIRYMYRGKDPMHRENVSLRLAMRERIPLIYFFGLFKGLYCAAYPAFIEQDFPNELCCHVRVDDSRVLTAATSGVMESEQDGRRRYITVAAQHRLHQESFRARVLAAYKSRCAVCRLGHKSLLDAAHILPDHHPKGEPWVSNGLALCKIHHAAFDRHFLGIRPGDHIVEIRRDILEEEDGPMLRHGLQDLHGKPLLVLPRSETTRPKEEFLAERYELFRSVG